MYLTSVRSLQFFLQTATIGLRTWKLSLLHILFKRGSLVQSGVLASKFLSLST